MTTSTTPHPKNSPEGERIRRNHAAIENHDVEMNISEQVSPPAAQDPKKTESIVRPAAERKLPTREEYPGPQPPRDRAKAKE